MSFLDDLWSTRRCSGCGCTTLEGCWPPCWWVTSSWCSGCEIRAGRRLLRRAIAPAAFGAVGAIAWTSLWSADHHVAATALAVLSTEAAILCLVFGGRARRMIEVQPR